MTRSWTRRGWLATAAGALSYRAAGQTPPGRVRIGFIGVGARGGGLLSSILLHPEVDVPVVCDIDETNLRRAQGIVDASRHPGRSRGAPRRDPPPGGRRRTDRPAPVLVVDDSISVRTVVARLLRSLGHEVEEVSDGLEALGKLRSHAYGMVLSDLEMPRMDGFELLAELSRLEIAPATTALRGIVSFLSIF